MSLVLYRLSWLLLLPVALVRLVVRGRREPAYLRHVRERLGCYSQRPGLELIWLHAVSVGETRAAQPLIEGLLAQFPSCQVLITHTTPTGRATSEQLFGGRVLRAYLPYDCLPAVRGFLRHFRPRVGILLETELWPELVHAAAAGGMPLFLVNARLSRRSARGYARLAGLTRATLRGLSGITAQSRSDARRLRALGARRVDVFGNLKYDVRPAVDAEATARTFRAWMGGRAAVLAASTRAGEEALLLDAWLRAATDGCLLVIVPRHPQRFDEVARLVTERGLVLARRSRQEPVAAVRVWLGDSLGELHAYYMAAEVALIGGSFLDYGGQNPIEPCVVGTPAIVGPHTHNFAAVVRAGIGAGALLRAADADEAVRMALGLIGDRERRAAHAGAGREFARRHQGSSERTLTWLAPSIR